MLIGVPKFRNKKCFFDVFIKERIQPIEYDFAKNYWNYPDGLSEEDKNLIKEIFLEEVWGRKGR